MAVYVKRPDNTVTSTGAEGIGVTGTATVVDMIGISRGTTVSVRDIVVVITCGGVSDCAS